MFDAREEKLGAGGAGTAWVEEDCTFVGIISGGNVSRVCKVVRRAMARRA